MTAAILFSVTGVFFAAPLAAAVLWARRGGRGGFPGLAIGALGGAAGAVIGGLGLAAVMPSDAAAFTGSWLGAICGAALLGLPRPERRPA
ncbi:MAG TPA: hypothetical protein VGF45_15655 [Polyangia bacterium]